MTTESLAAAEERHANNLELFLDLVFVFAVTQLAVLIGEHVTLAGTLKGVLVAFLVWWQWSQFTWVGAALDLQRHVVSRALVLCAVPVTLVMTIAVPSAFGNGALWFAWAYFGVQVLVLGMQGAFTITSPEHRRAFLRYSTLALLSPAVVVLGAYLQGDARVIAWSIAAALDIFAAIRAGGDWSINPTHFAERHALFIIIALGEVVVAAGATAFDLSHDHGLTGELVVAVVVAVGVACLLWWSYFAYVPEVGERALAQATPRDRGALARDFFTLGHFPLVVGIVLYSVVVEHLLGHPSQPLAAADRWLLTASVVGFTGGLTLLRYRLARRWSPERLVVIGLTAVSCAAGGKISGVVLVALIAVIQGAAQAFRYRRYRREEATLPTPPHQP
jgi:low temperature requirement protein LtrA